MIEGMTLPSPEELSARLQHGSDESNLVDGQQVVPAEAPSQSNLLRRFQEIQQRQLKRIDDSDDQRLSYKGYSDGFMTAKIFATRDMSKLGFDGQYIQDSIARLGSGVVPQGKENQYRTAFLMGQGDGEAIIVAGLQNRSQS